MKSHVSRRQALQTSLQIGLGFGLATVLPAFGQPASLNARLTGDITGIHDPSLIRQGSTYHLFSTAGRPDAPGPQISIRTSSDLLAWKRAGAVFPAMPAWVTAAVPDAKGLWSPDVQFFNGKYWLYYAASTPGSNVSAIGVATNATLNPSSPNYRWEDQGEVMRSRASDKFNAIDPSLTVDANGLPWLVYGSFWDGIMLVRLNPATGKPPAGVRRHNIAWRPAPDGAPQQIEAATIVYRAGWYYLFASYDLCCGGFQSNYYTSYGRSRSITGPYLDKQGRRLDKGYATNLVRVFPPSEPMKGPGGGSVLRDGAQDYYAYQAYDQANKGVATLRIAPLVWDADGWATAIK